MHVVISATTHSTYGDRASVVVFEGRWFPAVVDLLSPGAARCLLMWQCPCESLRLTLLPKRMVSPQKSGVTTTHKITMTAGGSGNSIALYGCVYTTPCNPLTERCSCNECTLMTTVISKIPRDEQIRHTAPVDVAKSYLWGGYPRVISVFGVPCVNLPPLSLIRGFIISFVVVVSAMVQRLSHISYDFLDSRKTEPRHREA